MLEKISKYIETKNLYQPEEKLLVAVSGGIDSVVLLDLLVKLSLPCAIAHCNFQLRGEESDQDEKFVLSLGKKYDLKTHNIKFHTRDHAENEKISTQMAARELRYKWFEDIAEEYAYSNIAIAHNSDDNIETFHLNLSRGTGLAGIIGMDPKSGKIIRPILWASRKDIVEYCQANNLHYREDSSNSKINYKRNFLRHKIIPKFDTINPSYSETMVQNMEFFRQSAVMLDEYFELLAKDLLIKSGGEIKININKLKNLPEPSWFLFKLLNPFGFNSSQINSISLSLESEPGKKFYHLNNTVLKDRDFLILSFSRNAAKGEYLLEKTSGKINQPINLEWNTHSFENYHIKKSPQIANLDASKISYPLTIRKWQDGDSFKPFGMQGIKKLSDFFIDQKLSFFEKENIWLLLSDNKIVWVIGHRIDDRFRVRPGTEQILEIEMR